MYFYPNWSPNGSQLAITVCTQGCVIGLLDVNTLSITRLPVRGAIPVWSPDGSMIALVDDTDIVIIKPTGEELARIPAPTMFSGRVAWSP
jgi:Tol biopolymer transport system component